jgi:hypothetical protein
VANKYANDSKYVTPADQRARVGEIIANRGVTPTTDEFAYLSRQVQSGAMTFDDVRRQIDTGGFTFMREQGPGSSGTQTPAGVSTPAHPRPGGGTPTAPVGLPPTPRQPTVDFYALARAMYPWLPEDLIRAYAGGLAESNGNPDMGLGRMRQHQTYDLFFKGNRRADGTFRHSEAEYIAVKDGYRQNLAARGINPDVFSGREHEWIEGDVSVQEHEDRIRGFDEQLRRWGPEGTNGYHAYQAYARMFGTELTEEAVLVSIMDPKIGTEVIKGRIPLAQIGGAAASFGYQRSLADARRLQGWGLGADQALEVYGAASQRLTGMSAMAQRAYDPRGGVDIGAFEEGFVGRNATQQQRFSRNLQAEQASFGRRGVAAADQDGRLTGLRQR